MLAPGPDYLILVIKNLPVKGAGTVLSFIGGRAAGDGESQDQNPSLATVDRNGCVEAGPPSATTWRHGRPNA